jgi:porphobilinogen deaminase
VTLGTRGSALARAQTELVAARLGAVGSGVACSTRVISTAGDRTQDSGEPLPSIGG